MNNCFAPADRRDFSRLLLQWFAAAMRPLPWRADYDPYHVWISEIMLQQTQMERGVRYFEAWLRRFPDIRSVAEADENAILSAWEGLGYYSRARNLHAAAKRIMVEHGGRFPQSLEAIAALPGVGGYTAGAIASIAFNLPVIAVDANVLRIFARILDLETPPTEKANRLLVEKTVRELMPDDSPRLFNQALMELGALVCAKTPRCDACPVGRFCAARQNGTEGRRPVKPAKAGYRSHERVAGVILCGDNVLIRKRPPTGLWAGLWEFPGGDILFGETPKTALARVLRDELGIAATVGEEIAVVRHGYTTNRVTLHGFICSAAAPLPDVTGCDWVGIGELGGYAFAAGQRKLLERLGWKRA